MTNKDATFCHFFLLVTYFINSFCIGNKCNKHWLKRNKSNGKCLYKSLFCDGVDHCINGEDEGEKICTKEFCRRIDKFKCSHNVDKCLPEYRICNGNNDCPNGEDKDEKICAKVVCQRRGKVKCNNSGKCIHKSKLCNGYKNCPNGEDEGKICTKKFCRSIEKFKCSQNVEKCIPNSQFCNGDNNCPSGEDEDEKICTEVLCRRRGEIKCNNSTACGKEWKICDGKIDCPNGEDEDKKICIEECRRRGKSQNEMIPCPDVTDRGDMVTKCTSFCKTSPDVANRSTLIQHGLLWHCPHDKSTDQYILPISRCNGISDCNYGQDESDDVCGLLDWYVLLVIVTTGRLAIFLLIHGIKRVTDNRSSLKCEKCETTDTKSLLDDNTRIKIKTFMGIAMNIYFKVWVQVKQ